MQAETFRNYHLPYRLYRLRRRILAFSAMPLLGAAISIALHPQVAPLADPATLLIVMSLWSAFVVWHHAVFPGGWPEALPLSVTFTATLALTGELTAYASAPALADLGVQRGIFNFALSFMAVSFLLIWLLPSALVNLLPTRLMRTRHSGWYDVAPDDLRSAIIMSPGETKGHHRCGQPDADGFHPVWFTSSFPNEETFEPEEREMCYKVKMVEEGEDEVVQHAIVPESGSSSMARMRFIPQGEGTRYEIEEVHDNFNDFHRILFWLDDAQEDYLTAIVDEIHQRPARAIKQQNNDIMISRLARWMKRSELADPH